jgi:hypothetical protein
MSKSGIWKYFKLSGRVAICQATEWHDDNTECKYSKDYPPRAPTTSLQSHLQNNHPKLFAQLKKEEEEKTTKDSGTLSIKRAFASTISEPGELSIDCDIPAKQPTLVHSFGAIGNFFVFSLYTFYMRSRNDFIFSSESKTFNPSQIQLNLSVN